MQNKINLGIIGKNFGYRVIYKAFLKNSKYKIKGFSFRSKKINKIEIPKNIKIYSGRPINWVTGIIKRPQLWGNHAVRVRHEWQLMCGCTPQR